MEEKGKQRLKCQNSHRDAMSDQNTNDASKEEEDAKEHLDNPVPP